MKKNADRSYEKTKPKQTQSNSISKGAYMRREWLTLIAVIVALVLLLQIGCQEQAKAPEVPDEPEAPLAAAEPEVAQAEVQIVPQAGEPAPKITFDNVVHDFGDVAPGKKNTGEFKITNTGDGPLKITEVKRCCGTVTSLDKEELAPGESGTLKVVYNSGSKASVMRRKLYVSSNDKANPRVELTIKARIVPKVTYEPQRIRFVLKDENAGCPNITLASLDNQPFSINAFTSTGGSITADVDSSVEATKFVLQPKVDLEKLKSRSAGNISIGLTHPECAKVYIYFSTLLEFEFKPRSIIVLNPEPQKPLIKKVSLINNYNEDFEVESTSSQNSLVKVLSQKKTANGYQFEVEITAPPEDDTGRFSDMLYVKLKSGEKLAIKCYGRYLEKRPSSGKK
jgi:hypothetical protein